MATDATGVPSTNFSIPKLLTSADAPSGKGLNSVVDYLDTMLAKGFATLTAKGDIVYASADNVAARLPAGSNGQVLTLASGVPSWATPSSSTSYRKSTTKTVNTTTAATDLLNGEITIGAGVMGTTGVLRLTAWGDHLQNSGGNAAPQRFQLILGGTTLLDTNTGGGSVSNAARGSWRVVAEIMNLGAANSQMSSLDVKITTRGNINPAEMVSGFTTGTGSYQNVMAGGDGLMYQGHGVNPSTAVDTSAAKLLELKVINGSASASYETKLLGALIEIV
jgi:hypothetical protein